MMFQLVALLARSYHAHSLPVLVCLLNSHELPCEWPPLDLCEKTQTSCGPGRRLAEVSENGQTDSVVRGGLPYPVLHLLYTVKPGSLFFGPVFILMGGLFVVLVQVQPS